MTTNGLKTTENLYGQIEYEIEENLGGTLVYIVYMPAKKTLDLTTLRPWLDGIDRTDLGNLIDKTYHGLNEALSPMFLAIQIQRGGLKVNKPSVNSPTYNPACFGV